MQDPDLRAAKFGLFCSNAVLLSAALAYGYWAGGDRYHFEWDWSATVTHVLFVALLSWMLIPSTRLDDGHLDDTGNSFALRLGKATKRCLRRLKLRL